MKKLFFIIFSIFAALVSSGCGKTSAPAALAEPVSYMPLKYAHCFTVGFYPDGCSLIEVTDGLRYYYVPQGCEPPVLPEDVTLIRQPADNLYVAASAAMDLFDSLGHLDSVAFTSTAKSDWSLPAVADAMDTGLISYVGKYNAPDYEQLTATRCPLAIESTMIYHAPEVKEKLESLNIPVFVEHSGYEDHPLGRAEWIRLYGLLLGCSEKADAVFEQLEQILQDVRTDAHSEPSCAFFYLNSAGTVNIRKPGDYVSRMIELAGGRYIFTDEQLNTEPNALSTMNLQFESFYTLAKDADILIYNSTVTGAPASLRDLLQKEPLLADFTAVKTGKVWFTGQNVFQKTTGAAELIREMNRVFFESDPADLCYLHKLN